MSKKFFDSFRKKEEIFFDKFLIEEIIYKFNEKYKEPAFSLSLIKGDTEERKINFLLFGKMQGCLITPKYQHTLFPQTKKVGGDPSLKCDFYTLFLLIPSLFLLYTEDVPMEKIPEISIQKFVEFVNFILSNQKKGISISLILAEREKLESSR